MPDQRHIDGDVCELICAEYFLRLGYWVFPAAQASSPVDLVIINEDGARLIQVKKDAGRTNPGRNRSARIHRTRSELQKALGVEMVYVDPVERTVYITDHNFHANRKVNS